MNLAAADEPMWKRIYSNKLLAWVLVIGWMTVIYAFSAQAHSGEITEAVLGPANLIVRKSAHMTEYCILYVLLRHAFVVTDAKRSSFWPFLIAAVYAMTDEYHQIFVPGRSATVSDVLIDSFGACAGWFLYTYLAVLKSFWSKTRS
ncbi:MAG TPA: VanZ family protein [Trichormus sp.]|jgi:VanZ family protein